MPQLAHRHLTSCTGTGCYGKIPDVFEPGRFLGECRSLINCYSYLPFGAGPRMYIRSTFALQEATIVLVAIIRHFSMQLAPGHRVWPILRVTLKPAGGLPMIVRANPVEPTILSDHSGFSSKANFVPGAPKANFFKSRGMALA